MRNQNNKTEYEYVVEQIKEINQKTKKLQKNFDFYTDFDLIDSCIYEMLSLKSKQKYLLKRVRQKDESQKIKEVKQELE